MFQTMVFFAKDTCYGNHSSLGKDYAVTSVLVRSLRDAGCATVLRNGAGHLGTEAESAARCIASIAPDGHVLVMKIPRERFFSDLRWRGRPRCIFFGTGTHETEFEVGSPSGCFRRLAYKKIFIGF